MEGSPAASLHGIHCALPVSEYKDDVFIIPGMVVFSELSSCSFSRPDDGESDSRDGCSRQNSYKVRPDMKPLSSPRHCEDWGDMVKLEVPKEELHCIPTKVCGEANEQRTCEESKKSIFNFVEARWSIKPIKNWLGIYPIFLLGLWVLLVGVVGEDEALPRGFAFSLLLLELFSLAMGEVIQILRLPPLVGMLAAGIVVANLKFIMVTDAFERVAHPIRLISVGVLITRGALCVNPEAIRRHKSIAPFLAGIPCIIEAAISGWAAYCILEFPWEWSALLGCILCSMSGVILMPLLATLDKTCCGKQSKQVISITRTSCGLDAILSICLTNLMVGFIFSSDSQDFWGNLLRGLVEIGVGFAFGIVWGMCVGVLVDPDDSGVQLTMSLFCGCVLSMIGMAKLHYPKGGAPAVFSGTITSAALWRSKTGNDGKHKMMVNEQMNKLWWVFQPFLFGIFGVKTNFIGISWDVLAKGLLCMTIGLSARIIAAAIISRMGKLNGKQQLFIAISWIPKGTVQAAVAPIAYDIANRMKSDNGMLTLATHVVNITVAATFVAAALGSTALLVLGKPFLKRC